MPVTNNKKAFHPNEQVKRFFQFLWLAQKDSIHLRQRILVVKQEFFGINQCPDDILVGDLSIL